MTWKEKYDKWQIIFANFSSIALIFAGGYLMVSQPANGSVEYPFAAGLWATILGASMAISSVILETRLYLQENISGEK